MNIFLQKNKIDELVFLDKELCDDIYNFSEIENIISNYGGRSFERGLFRIHSKGSSFHWSKIVSNYFPKYENKFHCFGFDWVGRQFAINKNNSVVYMFDYATGEAFELDNNLNDFFNEDLVDYRDDTLDTQSFLKFLKMNNDIDILDFEKQVSFKKPLFLGGEDNINNLEIIDSEIAWEINRQLFVKINK